MQRYINHERQLRLTQRRKCRSQ